MALVSVYLAETDKLFETCDKIDESKKNFEDKPKVNSSNSSVNAITSEINELGNEIKEDYKNTSNKLRDYTNKVENNEKELKSRAVSILDDSVTNDIPAMIEKNNSNKKEEKVTGSSTKTNNNNANNSKNSETLKDLADEFFETQRKNGTFVTSPIQSNTFASSVGNLNDISTSTTLLDPERISNAAENTKKENEIAEKRREEEKKQSAKEKFPYVLDEISDSIGAIVGNPLSIVGNAKNNIFSAVKIGGYAYSGLKSLVTGEKLSDVADETIEKIGDVEKTVDDEFIAAKMFLTEGAYSAVESVVKGAIAIGSDAFTGSNESTSNDAENVTSQKEKNTAEEVLENFLGTNWVNEGFNTFYEQTEFGNHLKESVIGFGTQRDMGTAVGSAIPTIAVGVATGGTGTMIVGGLSSVGSSTTSALQDGATVKEATDYGAIKGALTAATFGLGKVVNGLTPFKVGTTAKTLGNAGARVLADTGLGAVTGLSESALRQLYIPRNRLQEFGYSSEEDWNNASFGDKYNAYFESSGGWDSIKNGALTGAAYSIAFEGLSAIKEISAINSANKLYSEVAENNAKIKDINNNGVVSDNLEDLLIERNNLKSAYDNLDAQGKYYFNLSMAKDAINSGNITSAGIDNLLNSGNVKAFYDVLSNKERLALFDAMDETQMQSYFDQIGSKEAQKFINKNSSYITDKFFNRDITNSIWSNNTTLAIPSVTSAIVEGAGVNAESISIMYSPYLLPTVSQNIGNKGSIIGNNVTMFKPDNLRVVELNNWLDNDMLYKFRNLFPYYVTNEQILALRGTCIFQDPKTFAKEAPNPRSTGYNDGKVSKINLKYPDNIVKSITCHESMHQISSELQHYDPNLNCYIWRTGLRISLFENNKWIYKYDGINETVTEFLTELAMGYDYPQEEYCGYQPAVRRLKKILNMNIEGFNVETIKKAYIENNISALSSAIDRKKWPGFFETVLSPAFDKAASDPSTENLEELDQAILRLILKGFMGVKL